MELRCKRREFQPNIRNGSIKNPFSRGKAHFKPKRVLEAIDYWNHLPTLKERLLTLPEPSNNTSFINLEELIRSKIVSEESFNNLLTELWFELKSKIINMNRVPYWDFIYAQTYEETVLRAILTSFLVTYGFAKMNVNPIEEETFLIPYERRFY